MLSATDRGHFQALSSRDRAQASGLMTKLEKLGEEAWCHEVIHELIISSD
jgi:hypothetical protein